MVITVDNAVAKVYSTFISPKSYHGDSIAIMFQYDTTHQLLIDASSGESSDRASIAIDARLPRVLPQAAQFYITPNDPLVKANLNEILRSYPLAAKWIAIRDWGSNNVRYVSDADVYGREYAQLPKETLQRRTGDCEDYAILLVSLLRAAGYPDDSVFVVLGRKGDIYHGWVRIRVDVIGWQNIEPQAPALFTFVGDRMILSGFVAMYYFNDVHFSEWSSVTETARGRLIVAETTWLVNGHQVFVAKVGDNVETTVLVRADGGRVYGLLTIRVRKDIPYGPDTDYREHSSPIDLAAEATKKISFSWSPDTPSGSDFRGYFLRILLDGTEIWAMPDSYPPRLQVGSTKKGTPQLIDTYWTISGTRVTEAKVGQTVYAHVAIKAVGGTVEGTVTMKVKKDRVAASDVDFAVKSFHMSIPEGQSLEIIVSFVPDQKSSLTFRGFFIHVDLSTWGASWTMPADYPPRLKVL